MKFRKDEHTDSRPPVRRKSSRKKILLSLGIFLAVLLLGGPMALSLMIYQDNFGSRHETISWMARSVTEFEGLKVESYRFPSNHGQEIACFRYSKELPEGQTQPKGIVVIAHGLGGGGHNSYMDAADVFASSGYRVYAYDATGNDDSEGKAVGGLPQGVIDLDYAIRFIKDNPENDDLPIMLFGHSWGAYSAGSVLNLHPDVRAVVLAAGFNQSIDIIEEEGRRIAGDGIRMVLPYISLIEKMKFARYASCTCEDGFEASDAGVMMIHSADDEMISCENQFDHFQELYRDDPRFRFIRYEDRGHNYLYYSDEARLYVDRLNEDFDEFVTSLDGELTAEIKTAYMNEHLDKKALFKLDDELMSEIVEFYDQYAK